MSNNFFQNTTTRNTTALNIHNMSSSASTPNMSSDTPADNVSSSLHPGIAALLQSAAPSSGDTVIRIDSATLSSLLRSIDTLRDEKAKLESQLTKTSSELVASKQSTGPSFTIFSKLPPELQCMVWEIALTEPQIHVIGSSLCSTNKIHDIVLSCKTAAKVFKLLKLDFLRIAPTDGLDFNPIRNYVNLNKDTIWLNSEEPLTRDPYRWGSVGRITPLITPQCGECSIKHGRLADLSNWSSICPRVHGTKQNLNLDRNYFPINTLALNANVLSRLDEGIFDDAHIETLYRCKVEKVLIVMGNTPVMGPETVFSELSMEEMNTHGPSTWGFGMYDEDYQDENGNWIDDDGNPTNQLFDPHLYLLDMFQAKVDARTEKRKLACRLERLSMKQLDDKGYEYYDDLSTWKFPDVKWVYAKPADGRWKDVMIKKKFEEISPDEA